jgi:hypothetical protein
MVIPSFFIALFSVPYPNATDVNMMVIVLEAKELPEVSGETYVSVTVDSTTHKTKSSKSREPKFNENLEW